MRRFLCFNEMLSYWLGAVVTSENSVIMVSISTYTVRQLKNKITSKLHVYELETKYVRILCVRVGSYVIPNYSRMRDISNKIITYHIRLSIRMFLWYRTPNTYHTPDLFKRRFDPDMPKIYIESL
jgi:hypothetical protein